MSATCFSYDYSLLFTKVEIFEVADPTPGWGAMFARGHGEYSFPGEDLGVVDIILAINELLFPLIAPNFPGLRNKFSRDENFPSFSGEGKGRIRTRIRG
jgi:hypothetical protein